MDSDLRDLKRHGHEDRQVRARGRLFAKAQPLAGYQKPKTVTLRPVTSPPCDAFFNLRTHQSIEWHAGAIWASGRHRCAAIGSERVLRGGHFPRAFRCRCPFIEALDAVSCGVDLCPTLHKLVSHLSGCSPEMARHSGR